MSSEDKSQEASDCGLSPPPGGAGTTPVGSPTATDKRPRGRPRKDAAAATPKSRRKSRSRGKATADDEDSLDGMETGETEITQEAGTKEAQGDGEGGEDSQSAEGPDEDKPCSPLFQRSVSLDSAGSVAFAADDAGSSREKLCAFCYCGERSLLGQGELKLFGPTPGYVPLHIRNRRACSENDDDGSPEQDTVGSLARVSSPDCGPLSSATGSATGFREEPSHKPWEELGNIGLPDGTDVQSLFDPTGQCCAHQRCAVWSRGVCRGEGTSLLNVDKAIDSGSTESCAYCKRLGASIKCCQEECSRSYHYPCAAAAGTFQDFRKLTLLCPKHIELAIERSKDEANCAVCDSPGDLLDQLFCTTCGQHYHGTCLDIGVTPLKRAGWQCPECKVCQTCKNPGEDSKMLVCDTCDKGYHTFCLQPVMDSIPTNGWRCKNCRVCIQCGTKTSSQWHHNCLLCEFCYQQQDAGASCPLCGKPLGAEFLSDHLTCQSCKRYLHLECERQAGGRTDPLDREGYICTLCKHMELEVAETHTCPAHEALAPSLESLPCPVDTGAEGVAQGQLEDGDKMEEEEAAVRAHEEHTGLSSVIDPTQEIQVTVTVTQGMASPEERQDLVDECRAGAVVGERVEGVQTTDEKTVCLTWTEPEVQQEAEVPADTLTPPTKETDPEPLSMDDEPMEVLSSESLHLDKADEQSALDLAPKGGDMLLGDLSGETVVLPPPDASPLLPERGITPPSEHSFSDLSSPTAEDKAPKYSPEASSESSAKLATSPLSAEASPRQISQSQGSSLAAGYIGNVPSATFIPVTPKIGMGKPAISKRKFSPGRPRVKQGTWSNRSVFSSPSWSPDRWDGWDAAKTRQPANTPIWSIKVGRGSNFPGRRRPRGTNLSGRGGRGRSKLKNDVGPLLAPGVSMIEPFVVKEEEENTMHNTVVMFSSSDVFTMRQDMCVVCGSFGQGAEGRLLACSQCGQCYHPYCVNIKITRVVLSKGWRCLECTVCEACGQASDPGRLLLCDDCDISYHTYCLDPPLQTVPKGSWKCKWCVSCTQCGATSPGVGCEWQNNYTLCAPCASLTVCPICCHDYRQDELIVQCRQCDRWMHACCQNLNSDEEVENVADDGFECAMCHVRMPPSQAAVTPSAAAVMSEAGEAAAAVAAQCVLKMREQDPQKTYTQDGVCLTESGLSQLQSLAAAASRRKRPKPKLKLKIINQNSVAVLQTPPDPQSEHSRDADVDDSREGDLLDCEGKSDSSPERDPPEEDSKVAEGSDGTKKRKRKPYRPGIGGFMVRQRSRTGQGKAKRSLSRKDSSGSVSENLLTKDEGWSELASEMPIDDILPGPDTGEKVKKRYRKKKTKLEEEFPSYLQEAFFGKDLLDRSKQSKQTLEPGLSDDDPVQAGSKPPSANSSFLDPLSDPLLSAATTPVSGKAGTLPSSEDPLADLSEVLNTDDDLLGMLSDDLVKPGDDSGLDLYPFQVEISSSPFAGLDIDPIPDEPAVTPSQPHPGRGPRTLPDEPLDGILSPELDKMVTDGAILGKLYKIPELEGKDVEEVFTAVLSPSTSQTLLPSHSQHPNAVSGSTSPLPNSGNGMFPRMPVMNGMIGLSPHFPPTPPMMPGAGPCTPSNFSPIHRMPFPDNARDKKFSQMGGDVVGPWGMPIPPPPAEGEVDTMSNAQRSTLKWEKEETLGEMATVAPVLYTNMNFPNLKEEFPDWSTRVKQIAKLWRKASSQERSPYVQKARDNRAALRINKVQMSNDPSKRQQQSDLFDPNVPLDSDILFKDPLKHKESEHEQEWKFRQGDLKSAVETPYETAGKGPKTQGHQQMRQKSKQQAKIEASQKLEQVKNEQQLQQQQQQQQFGSHSGGNTPNSGNQSPMTPQPTNGSTSPVQHMVPKDSLACSQLPGTPTSGSLDDVFLRPQPPPPTGTRLTEACSQGQASQPQSPQMFSTGTASSSSRPSSPWDPYAKMVGTPRPPPIGSSTPRRNSTESCSAPRLPSEQQERGRPSSGHESFGSPTSASVDPYAKPPDTPRPAVTADPFVKPMGPPKAGIVLESQGRHMPASVIGDAFARPSHRAEAYQRMSHNKMVLSDPYSKPLLTPIPGSNESGSVPLFKAPMPPPHPQDLYNSTPSIGRRNSVDSFERPTRLSDTFSQNSQNDPYAHPPLTPCTSMNDNFSNSPKMMHHPQSNAFCQPMPMVRHPSRDAFAQASSTSRSDFTQKSPDPYTQPPGTPRPSDPYAQPPGTPRPAYDPYAQPPGTPRPFDPYSKPPGTPRPASDSFSNSASRPGGVDQYSPQQPSNRRSSPSHAMEPYPQPPGTPCPGTGERFSKSPVSQRNADSYFQQPETPRLVKNDTYAQQPNIPKPVLSDPYSQPPGTPRPGVGPEVFNRPVARTGPVSQDPFSSPQVTMQENFVRPQTPKHSGLSDDGFAQPQSNPASQTPVHDPYAQAPMTPRPQLGDRLAREVKDQVEVGHEGSSHGVGQFSNLQQSTSNSTESQSGAQLPLGDTEEKLRQRQRLRELILRQQQQKSAIRQEKGLQEPSSSIPGTPRQWSQEETGQQNELFNRPPPPYPGTARGSVISTGQRFPGLFPGEQRGAFQNEGQFPRAQFSADVANMGMRPPEPRFGFPSGGQVTLGGQGHFLRSPHHMQGPMIDVPQQMRRSLSVDLSRTIGNNSLLLPQHFPPRSIPLQQHNIMGQPFIELRHRAPENRVRLPFAPPAIAGNVVDQSVQSQRPADPMLSQPSGITSHMQISSSMENPHQQSLPLNTEPQQAPVMRSSHPATTESFNVAPSALLSITPADQPEDIAVNTEGIEEKLDTDDSAVKDLEDVEVKDLDDEDLENLNLDPDSTKELDLETSDLHLDDFLKSGKFDIIAYTDPDLDLGDKKDMFNEELDLSDPIDDQSEASDLQKALSEKRNASSVSTEPSPALTNSTVANPSVPGQGKVKQESTSSNENNPLHTEVKTEVKECLNSAHESSGYRGLSDENVAKNQGGDGNVPSLTGKSAHPVTQSCAIAHPVPTPVLSSLLIEEKLENAGFASVVPTDHSGPGAQGSQLAGMPQNSSLLMAPGHIQEVEMNPSVTIGHRMDPSPAVGTTMGNPEFLQGPSVRPNYGAAGPQGEQIIPTGGQPMTHNQQLMFSQGLNQQNRPLLLEEQPLLLQDLLDQERQEQQQQRQMQAMIRQRSNDSFFPNIDFDAITDPIMKAKMVALKGINKMMVQSSMGMPPMVMNRIQMGGQQGPEGVSAVPQQVIGQDGKLASQLPRRNPPNFGPGFVNDSQKKQYEEWLQHTQQLLKMQQKFLEEQIGAHRKSKKALSAKQRTAKKAGREFPEEDAEQLKHVTEQQSVVQKQLEQIRKQQKEHAELIEEYRVKHLQCSMQQPPMVAGMQPQTVMLSGGPPINQPRMSPMMQMQPYHNQPNAPRMSGIPGWHPGAPRPIGPGVPAPMASQAPSANTVQPVQTANGGGAPHVKFDDNNPFSEGFQERERKERLREQQERQRVQLMQEVERQRALQQRMEMEQQGLLGPDGNQDTLSQMAFYGTDLPRDFMQPQRPSAPQQMFPQQGVQPSFMSSSPGTFFMQTGERRPLIGNGSFSSEMGPSFRPKHLMLQGPSFGPGQPRPPGFTGPGMMPQGSADGPPFGVESATPLPPNYPGSGQSLIQLYSNIIPEEKGKKKRNRKKKKDDDVDSVKTPSTPHSDLTAPLTPCVSDTSSTPTRGSQHLGEQDSCELHLGSSTPGSLCGQPPFELERQLSGGSNSTGGGAPPLPGPCQQPSTCIETDRAPPDEQQNITGEIKLERMETNECHGPREPKLSEEARVVKVEEGTLALLTDQNSSQSGKGESGNELLKHLLKNKDVPPLHLQQRLEDDKTSANNKPISVDASRAAMDSQLSGDMEVGSLAPDHSKKKQRTKRAPKSAEKAVSRYKKRKKEDEEQGGQIVCSNTDTLMTQLKQQLSLLPLMEPLVGVNFAHFPPYGSGQINGESRLSGTFGSASLDGVSDYYSQLIYKQNNLSNPPTPPASLPPTPPPVARQKMVNGFATTEELARKSVVLAGHDVTKTLGAKQLRPEEDLLARAIAQGPKTVDVPASLPTPPHNNQEELRGQDMCEDRDTPDSFIPSSSPESVVGMEINRYPDLSRVKKEPPSPAPSPVIPMLPSAIGKGSEAKQWDVKLEPQSMSFGPHFGQLPNCSKTGLVSIAITLNPTAAENITGVMAAMADLLCVKIPNSYEVSSTPDRGPLAMLGGLRIPSQGLDRHLSAMYSMHSTGSQGIMRFMRPPGPQAHCPSPSSGWVSAPGVAVDQGEHQAAKGNMGSKSQWCCHCKVVVLGTGVQKSSKDLLCNKQDVQDGWNQAEVDMVFCSHSCFVLYSATMQSKAMDTKQALSVLPKSDIKESPSKILHPYSNNISTLDVHCLAQLQPRQSPPSTPPITFPSAAYDATKADALKVTVKLKPRPRAVHIGVDDPRHTVKRWKGLRWRKWSVQVMMPRSSSQLPSEDEVDRLLQKLGSSLRPEPLPRDQRKCCFCHEEGDGLTDGPARLLNLDLDLWVHLNCALWSTEVYETQAGALINVELALRRGLSIRCVYCQRTGATSGCHRLRCTNVYHFTCALKAQCTFFKDKTMLCHAHKPRGGGGQEHELRYFAVFRRVYVQRDEVRQLASVVRRSERDHTFRVGSLVLHTVGQLLPQQMAAFHGSSAIFPVGYESSRIYWSMRHGNRRCRYLCSIDEKEGSPEFIIRVVEQGYEDLVLKGTTPKGVWDQVLEQVAQHRTETGTLKLFPVYLKGEDLFGLTVSAVTRIIESLPGVEACENYAFRYGRNPLMQLPLAINPSGCARSEPRAACHVKRPHTLTSTSTSKSFQSTITGEIGAPYSKQFVHSKSSQYRKMKTEWKTNVYLARSRIQGLGLYAARDIEKYTMVIEYIGTIIRNEVANRKEKMYESQNRGVYMFRIDSEHVIDATITGGPARYINHSCAPNCVAEVVTFEKGHKIIISSNRKIQRGEELCYDYKFDLEDDQHKIPCHCGAVNCRKWMN
ncbi:histone-lysine N-methyltransferase 2C isoform X4 [Scleropages formosus]|uniref:histone-lysine N-methyltransferase 2C isoform X4 n=1 Tax=Scleropages formosus TaxID=113540 RepID=UPI0010FA94EA|nr:histone-lysine N-methyltransferase 2C isoform X4 [Scleropages formosus]